MRGSLSWALVATIPFVFGRGIRYNINAPGSTTVQSAPTAAEYAEAVEASKITDCCLNIANALPEKIYGGTYNTSGYAAQSKSYYSAQERELGPACYVLPRSSQDVSTAIRALSGSTCKFAIRSGGHNPSIGSSNIKDGITLDLSFMKQVQVSPDRLSVDIGPGNRWEDVYKKLDSQSIGTSGGRFASVGVGGLVTGGGISFFSRERGFVCDNVLEFEVVLSDGSIVNANKDTNSDLWRALKGGSANFGVVTRIKMKAFELKNMWGGVIFHKKDDDSRRTLFKLFEEFTADTKDVHAHWIHTWSYVNAVVTAVWQPSSNIQYTKPIDNPPIFDRLRSRDLDGSVPIIPLLKNDVKISTITSLTQQIASLNPSGSRTTFTSLTFKNSAKFMEEIYKIANEVVPNIKRVLGLQWSLSFQSLPKIIYSKSSQTGGNALGLENEQDDLVILLLTATWKFSMDDDKMYATAKDFFGKVRKRAKEMGVESQWIYLNYADKWQDPIQGYGPQNVDALKQVAKKYDSKGLFQSDQIPGGFKLSKVATRIRKEEENRKVADGVSEKADAKDVASSGDKADANSSAGQKDGPGNMQSAAVGQPVDLPAVDVPAVPVPVPVQDVPAKVVPVEDVPAMPGHGM
ncbi:hypothetical protein E2P81_ATG02377 [Venturia nashicola]|uniref:FAD-binding PCMH-type domain-containing protein n=1 Tax=Venturia nashicola TaxID=86259 RepID=A0A4Z1P523_9PEZI|nr:hypothetical protein E6O75_ATG02438 [Venturia nashicola]TLD36595.1 hypothetical protein E2P81_ATG02377 [Venturia nashicola]